MENNRTKIKPEKPDTTRIKASLARQKDLASAELPTEESNRDVPAGLAGAHVGKKHLINHSPTTHVVDQCGVKRQSD